MKSFKNITLLTTPFLAQHVASLDCTNVGVAVVERNCEWDGCTARSTIQPGDTVTATCLADCSTDADPWVLLDDGGVLRVNDALICEYFGIAMPAQC